MLILNVMLVGGRKNICDLSAVASSDLRIYEVKDLFLLLLLCVIVLMQTWKTLALSHAYAHLSDINHDGNTKGLVNNGNPRVQG